MSQKSYYLASVADKFSKSCWNGRTERNVNRSNVFKDFEKYGIGVDIIRHRKFKAAVEPFIRNEISPENKEQLSTLLNDIWGNISTKLKPRKIDDKCYKTCC